MNKSVFITGGNRGIGLELCKKFAFEYNFKVYMGARNLDKAKEAIKILGTANNIIPIEIDVEFEKSISNAYEEYLRLKDRDEKLYIFINNAAAQLDWIPNKKHIKTLEIPIELLDRIYRINVFAPILTTRYFLESYEKNSRIVNVVSGSGEFWDPNAEKDFQIGYAATKSALMMVTKKLSAAVKNRNIYVNCACPGWCQTSMGGGRSPINSI
ncbi:SDR family NAD(P)-dependent oxidoreductase [uncultured Brachyspira sp.]|uniref:SDR family NAD(P)-dependent oxidoreductase n=1 Tax=uncultured Brachyspira sp. TaxID=221953 RepID=UPI002632F297|nr:SDR family NAD(P)-dependent oxidoreductase [uncultured Brachyspira sp.]